MLPPVGKQSRIRRQLTQTERKPNAAPAGKKMTLLIMEKKPYRKAARYFLLGRAPAIHGERKSLMGKAAANPREPCATIQSPSRAANSKCRRQERECLPLLWKKTHAGKERNIFYYEGHRHIHEDHKSLMRKADANLPAPLHCQTTVSLSANSECHHCSRNEKASLYYERKRHTRKR